MLHPFEVEGRFVRNGLSPQQSLPGIDRKIGVPKQIKSPDVLNASNTKNIEACRIDLDKFSFQIVQFDPNGGMGKNVFIFPLDLKESILVIFSLQHIG